MSNRCVVEVDDERRAAAATTSAATATACANPRSVPRVCASLRASSGRAVGTSSEPAADDPACTGPFPSTPWPRSAAASSATARQPLVPAQDPPCRLRIRQTRRAPIGGLRPAWPVKGSGAVFSTSSPGLTRSGRSRDRLRIGVPAPGRRGRPLEAARAVAWVAVPPAPRCMAASVGRRGEGRQGPLGRRESLDALARRHTLARWGRVRE